VTNRKSKLQTNMHQPRGNEIPASHVHNSMSISAETLSLGDLQVQFWSKISTLQVLTVVVVSGMQLA